MKLSTKGRYGLRAIMDLADSSADGSLVPISQIAERQEVSVSYLEHLFAQLRKAGLIRSMKGSQGGYMLAMPMERMHVGDVLRALEGDLSIADEASGQEESGDDMNHCIRSLLWDKVNDRINRFVDSVTLSELVKRQRDLNSDEKPMYHI